MNCDICTKEFDEKDRPIDPVLFNPKFYICRDCFDRNQVAFKKEKK
jgi:hypothetical protein